VLRQVEWFGEQAVHSFFNWFYWFVNVGGCIAYLLVVYTQQQIGFDIGYLIPAATVLLGVVVFLLPRNYYRERPASELPWVFQANKFVSTLHLLICSGGGTGRSGGTTAPGRRRKGGAAPGDGANFWG